MNFYDLSAKLRAIDESTVAECGDMMPMIAHAPQQSDSVTMNVSMNGSGAGGIKDLMDILRNIEQAADDQEEPMVAEPHGMDGDVDIVLGTDEDMLADPKTQDSGAGAGDESYGNSAPGGSDARQFGLDAVTFKGDDMHSKGDVKRLRVNGAENPLQEALVERLQSLYDSIKEAEGPAMPDQPMNRIQQNVKPQADRPGLAPGGDPKLYDIQVWLNGRGYKIPTDGLNGPKTKEAYDRAVKTHSNALDIVHPSAVDIPQKIGQAIGTGVGWIETAWKNIKKGFRSGVDFDTPAPPSMKEGKRTMSRAAKGYEKYGKKGMQALAKAGREGKDLEPIQDKFNKYK
jgi:hypothetical protein